MILLALDQSSKVTGYAIFDNQTLIKNGKINLTHENVGIRLVQLREEISNLIKTYKIEKVAFEDIQLQSTVGNNVKTYKILAEVFGVIHELCEEINIPYEIAPSVTWKSALNIKGKTRPEQKANAADYVNITYNIKPTQDECDAICIGTYVVKK